MQLVGTCARAGATVASLARLAMEALEADRHLVPDTQSSTSAGRGRSALADALDLWRV
jgi:hypothetical protein